MLYNLRSLSTFNDEQIDDYERDFDENKLKLNSDLIKNFSFSLLQKPRSLKYSFTTDLFIDGVPIRGISLNSVSNNEINHSLNGASDLYLEGANFFEKVKFKFYVQF